MKGAQLMLGNKVSYTYVICNLTLICLKGVMDKMLGHRTSYQGFESCQELKQFCFSHVNIKDKVNFRK